MSRTYFIPLSSRSILYLDPSHPFIPLPSLLPHPIPTSFLPFYFPTFLTLFLPFTSYLSHFFISLVLPLNPAPVFLTHFLSPHPLSSISSTPSPIILESINPLSYFTPSILFPIIFAFLTPLISICPPISLTPFILLSSSLPHSIPTSIPFPPPFYSPSWSDLPSLHLFPSLPIILI